jgi:cyanate permease
VLGFAGGATFSLGLTLPPLLSTRAEVARVSAAVFTIAYGCTVVVAIICGAAWDVTGAARLAFLPIALAALPGIALAPTIPFKRTPSVDV